VSGARLGCESPRQPCAQFPVALDAFVLPPSPAPAAARNLAFEDVRATLVRKNLWKPDTAVIMTGDLNYRCATAAVGAVRGEPTVTFPLLLPLLPPPPPSAARRYDSMGEQLQMAMASASDGKGWHGFVEATPTFFTCRFGKRKDTVTPDEYRKCRTDGNGLLTEPAPLVAAYGNRYNFAIANDESSAFAQQCGR